MENQGVNKKMRVHAQNVGGTSESEAIKGDKEQKEPFQKMDQPKAFMSNKQSSRKVPGVHAENVGGTAAEG